MNLVKELTKHLVKQHDSNDNNVQESKEYSEQSIKCDELSDMLYNTLNEEQKKLLRKLEIEYGILSSIWNGDGFTEGAERGFRMGIKLILESLDG